MITTLHENILETEKCVVNKIICISTSLYLLPRNVSYFIANVSYKTQNIEIFKLITYITFTLHICSDRNWQH